MAKFSVPNSASALLAQLQKMTSSLLEKASLNDLTSHLFEELKSNRELKKIKAGLELQLESFNNVTSSIVRKALLPPLESLESLSNMTSQMIEQQSKELQELIQEPMEKLDALAGLVSKLKPEHWEAISKALPILIPHWIEHHTPKLELFLKPGTKLSVKALFYIHQALKDWHFLLESILESAMDRDDILRPMADMILQKNTKLMSQILILMFRAEAAVDSKVITLTSDDIDQLQKLLVSPKEIYLMMTQELNKENAASKSLLLR